MALYTQSELNKKTIAELKELAAEHDIEIEKGWRKPDLIEALAEVEEPLDDEEPLLDEEDELEDEAEEELDEEEDIDLDEEEEDLELPEEEDDIDEPAPAAKPKRAAKPKAEEKSGDTLAAKQVASILSTNLKIAVDAKTLRQFFRSPASTVEAVGSGGRYEFAVEDIDLIQREFAAWKEGHASRGTKRGPGKKGSPNQVIEEVEEVEEIEELEIEDELDDEADLDDLELEEED